MILKILITQLLFFTFLNANIISLNKDDSKLSILEHSKMYIDKTSSLKFEEIQKEEFKNTNTNYIKLGYTSDTLWIKFSIKNDSNKQIQRFITLTNPMIDTIELYTKQENGKFKKEIQGVLHLDKYDRNNILHPSFKVEFKANEIKEFYYKTQSISSANYLKLYIKDSITLYKDEFSYQLILALFFGAMFSLIIYNLFIFYFTKDMAYLYYTLFLFFIALNHSSYSIMLDYIITEKYTHVDAFLSIYYLSFSTIFALLFISSILNIKNYKSLMRITYILLISIILLMIVSTKENYLIELSTYLMFISILYVYYLTIYSLIKKHPVSKYIFIAWTINIIGLYSLAFEQYGIENAISYFPYFYELTTFLETILFSVALASKLNKTKELEQSVAKNEVLTRELHHRVKNNMQFIILMYRLKLANLTTNEIDEKLRETEGAIQAMSKTHEILYNQENLENIDTKLYFENLIDELKRSFNTKNIDIKLDIKATVDTQQAIYCGIILNELITNSFKYAFSKNQGKINISLEKDNNSYKFIIEDDGIGFDYEAKSTDSFGLSFVKAMVEDELKGKIQFENINGSKISINF